MALPYGLLESIAAARRRVEPAVRRLVHGGRPSWERVPDALPWFDRPDAETVAARSGDRLLVDWVRDGWVVVDDAVDLADVDAVRATMDGLATAPHPIPHLHLLDVRDAPDARPRNLAHAELLAWEPARREQALALPGWRVHGLHYHDAAARRVFHGGALRDVVSRIFRDRRARPFAAINFFSGSEQALHQDMAVFHIWPRNWLVGAWIALEDVPADAGPLVLHSGSHRAPMFPAFAAYPQTNLRTTDEATAAAYEAWIAAAAARYPRHEFLARRGQVLLWHGMLFHGGEAVRRTGSTRKSMVLHYTVRGADRAKEVRGPFRW
jgi:phytanoyl-CoA hydroxylase